MESENLTPLPWAFKDVRNQLFRQGWCYNSDSSRFEITHNGQQWVARLRDTGNGVNIDTHLLIEGKEYVI
jgi:hypothetical protein